MLQSHAKNILKIIFLANCRQYLVANRIHSSRKMLCLYIYFLKIASDLFGSGICGFSVPHCRSSQSLWEWQGSQWTDIFGSLQMLNCAQVSGWATQGDWQSCPWDAPVLSWLCDQADYLVGWWTFRSVYGS